jgi:hypothetical protein
MTTVLETADPDKPLGPRGAQPAETSANRERCIPRLTVTDWLVIELFVRTARLPPRSGVNPTHTIGPATEAMCTGSVAAIGVWPFSGFVP